jgi:hypothetical protein
VDVQHLITGLIVAGASTYACWALMPRRWRGALLRRMGREPVSNGSACGGCDRCGPSPAASADKVIRIHRR